MASTLLNDVKTALRISHNKLDSELTANIAEARAEMVRLGIDEAVAIDEGNPLIVGAIKTYVKMINAKDVKTAEGYDKSWMYQLDCIRKSNFTAPEPEQSEVTASV